MQKLDTFCLTGSEETHHVYIHQTHLVQVQRNHRPSELDLCLQLFQMLHSNSPNQSKSCAPLVRNFFNL